MELTRTQATIAAALVALVVAALLFVRLQSFGIWDPWELNPADQARTLASGDEVTLDAPPLPVALVAAGFGAFGVREWAGRFPLALAGVLTAVLAYLLLWRFAGRRAAIYGALITATTPLFLFNARQMLGDAPAFAAQALVALCAASAVFHPSEAGDETKRRIHTGVWLAGTVAAILLAIAARGALLGAVAPLLAVAVAAGLDGAYLHPRRDPRKSSAAYVVLGLALLGALLVALAVIADQDAYNRWLGGKPQGGNPPSFEVALEQIFHSFAPWSAVAVLAIGRMLWPIGAGSQGETTTSAEEGQGVGAHEPVLRIILVLWAAFAYAAHVLYTSRYGGVPYVGVVALAGCCALFLRDVERSRESWWSAALVVALFVGLLIRDFVLYPGGPIAGLGLHDVTVPEEFNPKRAWIAVLALFAVASALVLGIGPDLRRPLQPRLGIDWLVARWKQSVPHKIWLIAGAFLMLALIVVGGLAWVLGDDPDIQITSIAIRWARRLTFVPILIPIAVLGGQATIWAVSRLGAFRMVPVLVSAVLVAGWAAQGFLPALSAHFSPREIYDTYNALARDGEPLGEYRVSGRAAAYYASGDVREIETQQALIDFLAAEDRRWAAFPADELAAIDRAYRRRRNDHLFIADARSARVVLAVNQPIRGRQNENFVAQYVLDEPPARIQHRVNARYEDKIELIGYDLEMPNDGYVGAGQSFTVTWYWKCLRAVPGGFKIFLHVDGQGNRLNGDHDPVDGKYPVRLWDEGDVVVDRQELQVPANYRPGEYTFYIGFYNGGTRLHVEQGPEDDADRVIAGRFLVR